MTTQTLRNKITVTEWSLIPQGSAISYKRQDKGEKTFHLIVSQLDTLRRLDSIASIEGYQENPLMARIDDCYYDWYDFTTTYKLSQYDAFQLALGHEMELEILNDANLLELDAAVNALK